MLMADLSKQDRIEKMTLENDIDGSAMVAFSIMLGITTFAIGYGSWDPLLTWINGYRIFVIIVAFICILRIGLEYQQKMKEIGDIFKNSP
jgi:hypothetical protein